MSDHKKNVLHSTLQLAAEPGRLVTRPAKHIYHRHYHGRRFARTLFVVDIVLLAVVGTLLGIFLALTVFKAPPITDLVQVDATVAPTEVVSGAASTLVFRYQNQSAEELRHARLELTFPAYFELLGVESEAEEIAAQTFDLGTIAAGGSGQIKLSGVMFGDVGGEQTFITRLSFVYGERNRLASKKSQHTFSPGRSTLALELRLPERLIAGQEVQGQIVYQNTGEIDFPEIGIEPEWPDDFTLTTSTPPLKDGRFLLNALAAGAEGVMEFGGRLPGLQSIDFVFHPSFTFGEDRYRQETLRQTVELLPSQLTATTELSDDILTPGGTINAVVAYAHTGDFPITEARIIVSSDPSVTGAEVIREIGDLNPGDQGEISIILPTMAKPTINTSSIKTAVSYILPDGVDQTVSLVTDRDAVKVTTPVGLEAFGRYASPQGDQIGRGPLPPTVGEETKYWVFLTVRSTINALENVEIDAELGPGVSFTGKQSVSVGESLSHFPESNSVRWTIPSIQPTASGGAVVSVAFEVAITPDESMVGTTPTLVVGPLIRGRDAFTGAQVVSRGATITTSLPYDSMAAGLGVVE